jgi:hypothetical protein
MPHSVDQKAEVSPSAEVEMAETVTNDGASQPRAEDVDMTDASETQTIEGTRAEGKDVEVSGMAPEKNGTASGTAEVKLEDLFDMGSDDEEFPSSAMPVKKEASDSPDPLPSSPP